MNSITFAWTIAATLFAGWQVFILRIVAHEKRDSAFSGMMMYGISAVLACAILLVHPWPSGWKILALFAVSAGFTHAAGNYIRIESLKYIDSVIYFPINKVLGPLMIVVIGAGWFGDTFNLQQYIGIAFSITVPILLLSAVEHHRQRNLPEGLVFLVISTILTTFTPVLSKLGFLYQNDVIFFLAASQLAGTACSLSILLKQRGMRSVVSHIDRRDVWLGSCIGLVGFASYFTFLQALSMGNISLVYVIQAHYILIPIILSVWWYGEHINVRKAAAIIVSSAALILLYK